MEKISKNSIIRLSKYKNALQRLKALGFIKVFSDNLADALGIRATQVRKDFSLFKISGNKRGGYVIDELLERILKLLGKNSMQRVVIIGLGHIGTALLNYKGFRNEGINIVAGFDIDPVKTAEGTDVVVFSMEKLEEYISKDKIEIGIIAVPDIAAQRVLDLMIAAGIRGVLDFAPIQLKGPEQVIINNVNLVQELENLFYFVNMSREIMRTWRLGTRIFILLCLVITAVVLAGGLAGFYLLQIDVIQRSQEQVGKHLDTAISFYENELEKLSFGLALVSETGNSALIRQKLNLDYVGVATDPAASNGAIVRAAFSHESARGTRVVGSDELFRLGGQDLSGRAQIDIQPTQWARPSTKTVLDRGLVMECAVRQGTSVIFAGKLINRDFNLVDRIHGIVFEDRLYSGKPLGTVTLFLDDVRVSTNVPGRDGKRAVGTRVSEQVYDAVVVHGQRWMDRAFVVTDWYLTAYAPLKDIAGTTVGIIYVGLLEQPFNDMRTNILLIFVLIFFAAVGMGSFFTFLLTRTISQPLRHMLAATDKISEGDYSHAVPEEGKIEEFDHLAAEFNAMAKGLADREASISEASEKLRALNGSYLDLIGFVSHELKGILSSTILNAYSVRDGHLGMVNFKQRKALDSIARNLDYLSETVRNFLNLSRIEKGELNLHRTVVDMRSDITEIAVDAFLKQAEDRGMTLTNAIPSDTRVSVDRDLVTIVMNNLVGNAVKYGVDGGTVVISAAVEGPMVSFCVYNDGVPVSDEDKTRVFEKFIRLESAKKRHLKGTGLGLFITREIVERHGGKIRVESEPAGTSFIFTLPRILPE